MTNSELSLKYQRFLQMFWDPEPKNDEPGHPPICFIGEEYQSKPCPAQNQCHQEDVQVGSIDAGKAERDSHEINDYSWPEEFLHDFESRLWFTYRNEFEAIARSDDPKASAALTLSVRLRNLGETSGFTSDTGWGCMIRSGQCLLGNALVLLNLGRKWRRGEKVEEEKKIISLFADDPRAPFSIHQFVKHGAIHCGKHPGEWFGPSATAQCIETLSNDLETIGLRIYVAEDGARFYEKKIRALACGDQTAFKPTLLLAGVRIGIDRVTPVYQNTLKQIFKQKYFIGIAGGRPSASHYFVANQGDHLFYLDPHTTKTALPYHDDSRDYTDEEMMSLHTRRLRRLHIDKMDPSMLIAYLVQSEEEFEDWKNALRQLSGSSFMTVVSEPPTDEFQERESAIDEVETFDDESDSEQRLNAEASLSNGLHASRDRANLDQ